MRLIPKFLDPSQQARHFDFVDGRAEAFVISQFSIPNPEQKGLGVIVDRNYADCGPGTMFRKEGICFRGTFTKQFNRLGSGGVWKGLFENSWKVAFGNLQGFNWVLSPRSPSQRY